MKQADWNKVSVTIGNQFLCFGCKKNIEKTFSKVLEIKNKSLSLHPLSGNKSWVESKEKRSLGYLHIRLKEDKAEYTRDRGMFPGSLPGGGLRGMGMPGSNWYPFNKGIRCHREKMHRTHSTRKLKNKSWIRGSRGKRGLFVQSKGCLFSCFAVMP